MHGRQAVRVPGVRARALDLRRVPVLQPRRSAGGHVPPRLHRGPRGGRVRAGLQRCGAVRGPSDHRPARLLRVHVRRARPAWRTRAGMVPRCVQLRCSTAAVRGNIGDIGIRDTDDPANNPGHLERLNCRDTRDGPDGGHLHHPEGPVDGCNR